jgi:hypothetical protein
MMSIKEAKANARILKTFMEEQGTSLAYSVYLEAVARMAHHKNWATFLVAANAVESLVKSFDEVVAWPKFVFFFDEREENDFKEALYVLPAGVSLSDAARHERHGPFLTHGAFEVPEGFKFSDKTVAVRVYSTAPSVDRYGMPHYADEDKAAAFFREDLGCAAIDAMDVSFTDTGDDSSSRYWFEAHVHPEVAVKLGAYLAAVTEPSAPVSPPKTSPTMSEVEMVETAYTSAIADLFVSVAGQTVRSLMDALDQGSKSFKGSGESWLATSLQAAIEVEPEYRHLGCKGLMAELRKKARPVYDDLLLRSLGH